MSGRCIIEGQLKISSYVVSCLRERLSEKVYISSPMIECGGKESLWLL